jgi:hypothetical protein
MSKIQFRVFHCSLHYPLQRILYMCWFCAHANILKARHAKPYKSDPGFRLKTAVSIARGSSPYQARWLNRRGFHKMLPYWQGKVTTMYSDIVQVDIQQPYVHCTRVLKKVPEYRYPLYYGNFYSIQKSNRFRMADSGVLCAANWHTRTREPVNSAYQYL